MSQPQVTLVPFADLPDCAIDCGPLHDANGACVPPNVPVSDDESTYQSCFCEHGAVAGFKTGTLGVCNDICEGKDASGTLVAIQNWFAGACGVEKVDPVDGGDSSGGSGSGSGSRPKSSEEGGQSWVQMHWRWLVMIIVLVVAIITIWILAFWWRRRHLRKKEATRGLGKHPTRASWGPGAAPPEATAISAAAPGVFNSADSGSSVERSKAAARNNGVS